MPVALEPNELAIDSTCFNCIPPGKQISTLIYLLNRISLNMTPNDLATASRCFDCNSPQRQISELIYLLNNLSGVTFNITINSQIVSYSGVGPTSDGVLPPDLNQPAIAVKSGESTFTWSVALQSWDDV